MRSVLDCFERILPLLLRDGEEWNSLDINYHPPRVERLWRSIDGYNVDLHRIHPCDPAQALRHRHRRRSAIRVRCAPGCAYEMGIGYGPGPESPPLAARLWVEGGELVYEMTERDGWHYVAPRGGPSYSVMVTGLAWPGAIETAEVPPLGPLQPAVYDEILGYFRSVY